ncbi:MAG: ribosomal protein S18 acetylase RimI-like enzyme [Hyphomicrobiaceae bacterium]|jgi:ribosomal protein S18 acetylase RimI-like enzyme
MPDLRAMQLGDLSRVLEIIDETDDDDAESAKEDYEHSGFDNQYVLEVNDTVVGVTGFRPIEGTDKTSWLSWTYLDPEEHGKGYGRGMLLDLLQMLRETDARKIFVKVSNYEDPEDGKVYERALQLYQSIGFELELTGNDFYDDGEDQLILGMDLRLGGEADSDEAIEIAEEKPIMRFSGLFEIADSDGAYSFEWTVKKTKSLFEKRGFSLADLVLGLDSVKKSGGRKVFLTFPSNLPLIHKPLQAAGFKYVGQLENYYERGVHEMHFAHSLENIPVGNSPQEKE